MYISASAPDAPPLSDTTIGCFIRLFFWIAACIIRAIWSDAPPAPADTTISNVFVGSSDADGNHDFDALGRPPGRAGRGRGNKGCQCGGRFDDVSHACYPYLFVI